MFLVVETNDELEVSSHDKQNGTDVKDRVERGGMCGWHDVSYESNCFWWAARRIGRRAYHGRCGYCYTWKCYNYPWVSGCGPSSLCRICFSSTSVWGKWSNIQTKERNIRPTNMNKHPLKPFQYQIGYRIFNGVIGNPAYLVFASK